ncbi:MAG: DUF3592 domain-containing protein [Ardenticatenia bacterium]|nr:MAG: DUF3592 domain-containing protein [Ardenticatenia bacterium]
MEGILTMPLFPRLMRSAVVLSGLWHGPVLILLSLPFLLMGWRAYQKVNAYVDASAQATGRVVDVVAQEKTDADGNRQTYYYAVVEFTTPDGQTIRFQDSTGVAPASLAPHPGEEVPVLYNPENPHMAMVATWSNLWLLPTALLGIGGFIVLMGLLFFLRSLLSLAGVTISLAALMVALLHGRRRRKEGDS